MSDIDKYKAAVGAVRTTADALLSWGTGMARMLHREIVAQHSESIIAALPILDAMVQRVADLEDSARITASECCACGPRLTASESRVRALVEALEVCRVEIGLYVEGFKRPAVFELGMALEEAARCLGSPSDWWFPVKADAAFFARLRSDYPEDAGMSDEELHDHYADGRKYPVTWDHVGDAYDEYEKVVDAFFAIRALAAQHKDQR